MPSTTTICKVTAQSKIRTRPDRHLTSLDGEDEGAYAPLTRSGQSGEVTLASFSQLQQTPIEKLRKEASALAGDSSLGREVIADILIVLKRGITPAHLVEALILGIDGDVEGPFLPGGADYCIRVGNELYCNDGGRYPAETEPDEPEPEPEDDEPVEQPTLSEIEPDETDGRLDFIGPLAEAIDLVAQPGDSVLTDLFFASTEGSDAGLSGNGAFLGQSGESVFSGDSENTCLYISVDFDLPSVSTYQWAGSATFGFYFEGGACPQEGFPPPTDTLQVDATARFDGFMLIVDLTGVDLDDEPLSYTLTAPLREADPDD